MSSSSFRSSLVKIVSLQGKRLFFVTNNSLKTQRGFAQWLNEIGYAAKPVRRTRSLLATKLVFIL